MLNNYIKIAWRNIITRKFYTFLNICGLALAISCCIVIYLYSTYNLSIDSYHKNSDRICRLVYELHLDKTEYDKGASYAAYQAILKQIPQVKQGAFAVTDQTMIVNVGTDKHFKEEKTVSYAGADWFNLFSFRWLSGSAAQLDMPDRAVLRLKTAQKYFGAANAVGKIISINKRQIMVVGVIANEPFNTDLRSEIYLSLSTMYQEPAFEKNFFTELYYLSSPFTCFIKLNNAKDKYAVEKQIVAIQQRDKWKEGLKYFHFKLIPLNDNHFDTRYAGVVQKGLLWNLFVIGVLIIAIAVINYINIVVAQQTKRGIEIGTRKVLGGSVGQIFMQFIVESLLTSAIAVIIAVFIVLMILPLANNWLFTDQPLYILSYGKLFFYTVLLLLIISIGTGIYPAWLLSRISVARALKNDVLNLRAGMGRKVLVVFQNTVTQGLIVCTIIILMQVHLLKNTDIGFDRKMVVNIPVGKVTSSQKYQLIQKLKSIPGVQASSFCLNPPSSSSSRGATVQFDNRTNWEKWSARFALGDSAYANTFGLKLVAGRAVRNTPAVHEFLINETMATMLVGKYTANVIGKKLSAGETKGVIVGIVKDFNVNSLVGHIEPSVILQDTTLETNMGVKLSGTNINLTLNAIQAQYQSILPDQVFSYQFIDEQIAALYKKENIQQKLIWMAALVAIVISSLGLLGLVSLVALQRTKEIGIRKVLGASVSQICFMLSTDFVWMLLLAFLIAAPISMWLMDRWLQSFAYRVHIQWWIFAIAGCFAFTIAMLSVSFQTIKAAIANPVKSLRSE